MTSSPLRAAFSGVLSIIGALVLLAIFVILLSPTAASHMDMWSTSVQQVPAQVQGCTLHRNGDSHRYEVQCILAYTVEGKQYAEPAVAWSADSPFITRRTLAHALDAQTRNTQRTVFLRRYAPEHPHLLDDRWLTPPPAWMLVALAFFGCMAIFINLLPPTVERRSDMVYAHDEQTGRQALIKAPGARTVAGKRAIVQTVALAFVGLLCVYGLLNKPGIALQTLGVTGLQPVPATLVDCQHHWTGGRKGQDTIFCGFQYSFNGVARTGRAESVEFHFFPTDARLNEQGADFMQSPARIARVDPQHPDFAIACVDEAWFAPYSLGIFEGIVFLILFLLLPFLLREMVWSPQ